MVASGLVLDDFSSALSLLRRLDRFAQSARAALSEFLEIMGQGKRFFDIGVRQIYETPISNLPIFPLEGAVETLSALSQKHMLALVSKGKDAYQIEKLKKAGIDSRFFSKIIFDEQGNKKFHYQTVLEDLGFMPSQGLVCADRVSQDLIPARELGFKTVQMRWGRGLNVSKFLADRGIDYSISEIAQLKDIVNSLVTWTSTIGGS